MSPRYCISAACLLMTVAICIHCTHAFTNTNANFQREWYTDVKPYKIPLESFNWDFLFVEQGVWTVAHVVNPFMLTMILQDPWAVLLIVIGFESIEAAFLLVASGTYLLFINDNESASGVGAESTVESLVGDVFQGILGILLAKLLILVYKIPSWTPSVWSPYRRIWVKRILQLILMQPAFSLVNGVIHFADSAPWRYGIEFALLWLTALWALMLRWNWTEEERALFWSKSNKRHFELVYTVWFVTAFALLSSSLWYFTYPYFQVWAAYLFIVGWHLVALALQNRFSEFWYALDFGFRKQAFYHHQLAARRKC